MQIAHNDWFFRSNFLGKSINLKAEKDFILIIKTEKLLEYVAKINSLTEKKGGRSKGAHLHRPLSGTRRPHTPPVPSAGPAPRNSRLSERAPFIIHRYPPPPYQGGER